MTTSFARVAGLGAVSPVGLSAPATFAALRAGIARLGEIGSSTVQGELMQGEPLTGGRVPLELFQNVPEGEVTDWPGHRVLGLPQPNALASYVEDGPARLVEMVGYVVDEAVADAEWDGSEAVDVWIAVDAGDADPASVDVLTEACRGAAKKRGATVASVHVKGTGRAGPLCAAVDLATAFRERAASRALLVGVGSLIRPREVVRQATFGNLRSADRPRGVFPGECAAAIALERSDARPARARVELASALSTTDLTPPGDPCDARALSRALDGALSAAGGASPRPLVVCDLNGDRYRGLEWAIALPRVLGAVHGESDVWHPAEFIGDAGAGLGALSLAWAAFALEEETTDARRALVWGASDDGARAACVLTG